MNQASRLHPLLAIAAISTIVFSLVGIGAVTGLLPHTGATKIPEATLAPLAPSVQPASAPVAEVVPVVPPVSAEPVAPPAEVKPAKKHTARHVPVAHEPPVQIAQASATLPPPPPVLAAAPQIELAPPKPVCADCGTVQNFREVEVKGQGTGLGAVAGGVAGALLGHQFGGGTGKTVMTIAGAAGGALGGNQIEKNVRAGKHYDITVRMEDGGLRTVSQDAAPSWRIGDRVRIVNNQLTANP